MNSYNEQLGLVVWKYIDRMNDVCEKDTAEKILEEFVSDCNPTIESCIDVVWKEKYGYTYKEFLRDKSSKGE